MPEGLSLRTCSGCSRGVRFDELAADRSKRSGRKGICKVCDRGKWRAYYWANRKRVLDRAAARRPPAKRRSCSECGGELSGRQRVVCSPRCRDARYRRFHPDEYAAREAAKVVCGGVSVGGAPRTEASPGPQAFRPRRRCNLWLRPACGGEIYRATPAAVFRFAARARSHPGHCPRNARTSGLRDMAEEVAPGVRTLAQPRARSALRFERSDVRAGRRSKPHAFSCGEGAPVRAGAPSERLRAQEGVDVGRVVLRRM